MQLAPNGHCLHGVIMNSVWSVAVLGTLSKDAPRSYGESFFWLLSMSCRLSIQILPTGFKNAGDTLFPDAWSRVEKLNMRWRSRDQSIIGHVLHNSSKKISRFCVAAHTLIDPLGLLRSFLAIWPAFMAPGIRFRPPVTCSYSQHSHAAVHLRCHFWQ